MILGLVTEVMVALVPAIVLHEYAHGWAANRLGDPTAKMAGRLTVNPLKHVDPVGSVIVPGALVLMYIFGLTKALLLFGWAKPVPVNFFNLKNPKRDMMWVALAGPVVNIILAVIFSLFLRLPFEGVLREAIEWAVFLNIALAVFNMIPIPPLDGSRVMTGLLPNRLAVMYASLEPIGFFLVIVLLSTGMFKFIYPVIAFLARLLGVEV